MCIHGFVKFMQNLCSDLKVQRRIQGGIAGGGRRKRHHTFFFQINLQVNSASGFGRFVEARAVSAICVVSGTAEQLQIFLPKEVWCLFLLVGNPAVLDLCLAAQILTGHDSPDYYMQACVDDTFGLLYHHMISMIILSSLRT